MTASNMRPQLLLFWLLIAYSYSSDAAVCQLDHKDSPTSILPERVRLSEILIATSKSYDAAQVGEARKKAEEVRDAIRQGGAFADLARAHSQEPTAAQGGDLGYFRRGILSPSIEDLVFAMKVGEVSDVVRTKQGFVILQVTDHLWPGRAPQQHAVPGDFPVEVLNQQITPDLRPYLEKLIKKVRERWYAIIPYSARAPQMKQGNVAIEFLVQRDGRIAEQKVASSSGDGALDRAALAAVSQASPFSPLPNNVKMDHLALLFHFEYNPAKK